jgi:type VI secretion system secreted protein Hcp
MAVDVFVKIDGIDGESKDKKHPKEIQIESFSWGVTQKGTKAIGGGGGAGKANFGDFNFTHTVDAASPNLALHCANGKHIPSVTVTNRKAGDTALEYMIFKLSDVLISGIQMSGANEVPLESVSMNYSKIEYKYFKQNEKGAADGGPIPFGWDLKQNVKL